MNSILLLLLILLVLILFIHLGMTSNDSGSSCVVFLPSQFVVVLLLGNSFGHRGQVAGVNTGQGIRCKVGGGEYGGKREHAITIHQLKKIAETHSFLNYLLSIY